MNSTGFSRKKTFESFWLLWSLYLIFPTMTLLNKPVPQMWIGFALLACFVGLLIMSVRNAAHRIFYLPPVFTILVIFSLNYSPYLVYMFFYTAPLIGMLPTRKQFMTMFALMIAAIGVTCLLAFGKQHEDELMYLLPSLLVLLVLPFGIRSRMKSNELKAKLNLAHEEITRLAMVEERQRISRDLHDTLGHTLSLITLKSELAEKLIPTQPARAVQEVRDIQLTSRAALKQVRELVSGMNALSIDEELRQARQMLSAASVQLDTIGDVKQWDAPPLVQNILAMCLKEAITNVVKHSGARRCRIAFQAAPGYWEMTVADDGCSESRRGDRPPSSGRGLLGIKERLELIEGTMSFQMDADKGTQLTAKVPRIIKHQ